MGPQPFDCGNIVLFRRRRPAEWCGFNGAAAFRLRKCQGFLCRVEFAGEASMGPQPFDCGNIVGGQLSPGVQRTLQWGRSLSTAEINSRRCRNPIGYPASMGPQPFDCGNDIFRVPLAVRFCSFNGAAAFRLRKSCSDARSDVLPRCFNGAAAFRLRKLLQQGNVLAEHRRASMGPQPFDCGNIADGCPASAVVSSFNGAAAFRLRKSPRGPSRIWLMLIGFNGAAAFRLRKSASPGAVNMAGNRFNGAAAFRLRKCYCNAR